MNLIIEKLKQNPRLLIGLLIALFCVGLTWLRANQLNQLTARENELISELEIIRNNVKYSKNIEQDIQDLDAHVASIKERLFVEEERAININFFYKFEEKLDILISEVNQLDEKNRRFAVEGPDGLKRYSVIMYSMILKGTFEETMKFLYEIYQLETIMRVTGFQIDAASNDDGKNRKLIAKLRIAVLAENNQTKK